MTRQEFRAKRKALGMTQQEFADHLGYKHAMSISLFEAGKRKIPKYIIKQL